MVGNKYICVAQDGDIVVLKFNDRRTMESVAKMLNDNLLNENINGISIAIAHPQISQKQLNKAMINTSKEFKGEFNG